MKLKRVAGQQLRRNWDSMTKIIIDTNIVFSAFLNIDSRIGQLLINGQFYYAFYAPSYIRNEIFKHKEKIISYTRLTDNEFLELYELVMRNISVLNHSLIPVKVYRKAEMLCKSIDINDTAFVAVNELIKGKLWTGDIKLIKGLIEKGYTNLIRTEELYQDFIIRERAGKKY